MKIEELRINSYGKLKELELKFKNHINIIFGKNEAGKSTLINYIISSLYGISKKKNGKEFSDYDKYLPWVGEDFSGKLSYRLDDGKKIEVYRDFKKKNPKIFNEKMEDISSEFSIDKTLGNQFFSEQTKIDEELFLSTFVSNQKEVKLEDKEQSMLVQKIANLVGTGEDNTSFKLALNRINKRQLDEIGTERSREKPINIINREIREIENEKQDLEKYEGFKYEVEEKINSLKEKIVKLEAENEKYGNLKIVLEKQKIEEEKIKVQENLKKQNDDKIKELEKKIDKLNQGDKTNNISEIEKAKERYRKKNIMLVLEIIFIIVSALIKNNILKFIGFGVSIIPIIIFVIMNNKEKKINKELIEVKKEEELVKEKIGLLDNEIDVILKNNNEIDGEINKIKEKISNSEENMTYEEVQSHIGKMQKEINSLNIELHRLEVDKNNIEPKIEKISKLEEKYYNLEEKKKELEKLNKSMEIAKEILNKSYEIMKDTVTPKFTKNLSINISKITNGKYENVRFDDENGLIVENELGEYITAEKLSVGTIEELYLSLRLSMIEDLSEEKMPIFLDEAFAYFDDDRIKNFLTYINEKYPDRQFIIFTCTNREKNILNNSGIEHNYIELS